MLVEEYTLEADANVAEVMDTNTYVSDDIIEGWRSKVATGHNGTGSIYHGQFILFDREMAELRLLINSWAEEYISFC